MHRRRFLELTGVAAAAGFGGSMLSAPSASADVITHSGPDLSGWETVVGDGLWVAPGQDPVSITDLAADHRGTHSEIRANVEQRGVMAHNITFKRDINVAHMTTIHALSMEFRMPFIPSPSAWPDNAQTLEGSFFVWDGGASRLDHGIGFQWILNPWMGSFGDIRTWTDVNGGQWTSASHLTPDTEWHTAEFLLDPANGSCALLIDGQPVPTVFTRTPKPANWGTETAARLGAEIISLWPGSNPTPPSNRAQFRNWSWSCIPHLTVGSTEGA